MQDILNQLHIYKKKFSNEKEMDFINDQESEIEEMFEDMEKDELENIRNIAALEKTIRCLLESIKKAKEEETKTYEEYERQSERERTYKENFEKEVREAEKYFSESNTDRYMALEKCCEALCNAKGYYKEFNNGNSDDLFREWKQRDSEVREAEATLENICITLHQTRRRSEYYKCCEYEKHHYYDALIQHDFHSKRLEAFQLIVNSYKEFKNANPYVEGIEELENKILEEVDIVTKISIRQYENLDKKKLICYYFVQDGDNAYKKGWKDLAERFSELKQNDRSNPSLKEEPITIKMKDYLLEDKNDINQKNTDEEVDIGDEYMESYNLRSSFIDLYKNLVNTKEKIVSRVDDYYRYVKEKMDNYIKKVEDIIFKVCDVMKSENVKYENVEKFFTSTMESFDIVNCRIEDFIEDEENHPIHSYCDLLQNLVSKIETEYLFPLSDDIKNTEIDPLCFGLERYYQLRELDCKIERMYNILVEKEIVDLECNLLPIRRYKEQLILEVYRNSCLSVYMLLLQIMKNCKPGIALVKNNDKIKDEIRRSNERLNKLKNALNEIVVNVEYSVKQLQNYKDEIDELTNSCHENHGESYYDIMMSYYRESVLSINTHVDEAREKLILVNKMKDSIFILKSMINNPNGSASDWLMEECLLVVNHKPSEICEKKLSSTKRKKSSKIAPTPTIKIAVKSRSVINVEESKRNIELQLYGSSSSTCYMSEDESHRESDSEIRIISNIQSMYGILKNLLLWKYKILRVYCSSPIQRLYSDIENESHHCYNKCQVYAMNRIRYQKDYDELRYGIHGDWNWKLYKSIIKQLDDMKYRYKSIIIDNPHEIEFFQRLYYTLSQFCTLCESDCRLITRNYNLYYKDIVQLSKGLKNTLLLGMMKDLKKDIRKNLFGKSFKSCFRCFIPGICFGYPYAGKKWNEEKIKNLKLSDKEII